MEIAKPSTPGAAGPRSASARYPFPAYPNGWFRVAYSGEIARGEVKPLEYFGRELVLFRTESGRARVFDAYCPHLGAHLGVGGKVEGEQIRCPFHAWRFDADGRCNEIPYAKRIPARAQIDCWPVDERNGVILAYHHAQKQAPTWHVPSLVQIEDPAWSPLVIKHWKVRARWLDMNENCVDRAHFVTVHGTLSYPESSVDEKGHVFRVESRFEQKAPGGTAEGVLVTTDYGPGFQHVELGGIIDSILMNTATPIDEDYTDVSFAYSVRTEGDARKERLAAAVVKDLVNQFEHDLPIWENKACWKSPRLCDGDGPVGVYRKWTRQFFSPESEVSDHG